MNAKKREAIFQQWRSQILREARDLLSLNQVADRALYDPDVRADPQIESMVRAEIEERRAEFSHQEEIGDGASGMTPKSWSRPIPPAAPSASPDAWRATFDLLAHNVRHLLELGDELQASAVLDQMRAFQCDHPDAALVTPMAPLEEGLVRLRTRLAHLKNQIDLLSQQAVAASRHGDEQTVHQLLRRLSSIHAAHPRLLDDARLEEIREAIIQASDQHEHRVAAHRLVERERAVADEVRKLAVSVHAFHRVARTMPHDGNEYHRAEAEYLRTVREVRAHDNEWLAAFTWELADLLAAWGHPPPEAGTHVDRFLEGIRASLQHIRTEMHEIEEEDVK